MKPPNRRADKLQCLCDELCHYVTEEHYWSLYQQDDSLQFVRKVLPMALDWLQPRYPLRWDQLLEQACEALFNASTRRQALALAQIAYREAPITVRGAFYRAVSAGIYPDTAETHYRQCISLLLKLRRSGVVAYACIVDGTRYFDKPSSWSGLSDYLESVAHSYRCDLWQQQRDYLELFVEKDAMAAVLQPVTRHYDVRLNIIRGNCSETFAWSIAQQWQQIEKPIHAYYLGDHDPNGLDIERDLCARLTEMTEGKRFAWKRIAIDAEDFQRADLIGFAIKGNRQSPTWQTRHRDYLARYGDRCVEVDAIPSTEMRRRIQEVIESHIDPQAWRALKVTEAVERQTFQELVLAQKSLVEQQATPKESEISCSPAGQQE